MKKFFVLSFLTIFLSSLGFNYSVHSRSNDINEKIVFQSNRAETTDGDCFHVYSETGSEPKCHFEVNCDIGAYGELEEGGLDETDLGCVCEGNLCMQAKINLHQEEHAGWFVRAGTLENHQTRDMSGFENGCLIFCLKSPVDLGVGIRSSDIPEGEEESKIKLSELGILPDDRCREIIIPLDEFKSRDDRLDFSQIEVLFNIYSDQTTGGTGGQNVIFYVDSIQWCRECPVPTESELDFELNLNPKLYWRDDHFSLNVIIHNAGQDIQADMHAALILPSGEILFLPDFTEIPTPMRRFYYGGQTYKENLLNFEWDSDMILEGLQFAGGLTFLGTYSVIDFDSAVWSCGKCEIPTPTPTPTPSFTPNCYGVYSETITGCILDDTCMIGIYPTPEQIQNNDGYIELEEVDDTYCEPDYSMKATINVPMPDSFAGWFVRAGTFEEPDTIDMSDYADGSLWLCARSSFELGIGIRSADIAASDEESWVLLSDYIPLDDEWHEFCVPIPTFTNLEDELDLSQMEVLFNVFSNSDTGGTEGEEIFWIDNVRWCIEPCPYTPTPTRTETNTETYTPTITTTPTPMITATCYGVYSETISGCNLDSTCVIGIYPTPEGTHKNDGYIELEEVDDTYCEPDYSMKATINVPMPDSFAGWFVRAGTFEEPDTIDMSDYADGSLWLCARSSFELGIGIRSADIAASDEESWVLLSDYIPLDDEWHEFCIPVPTFTDLENELDLSLMEVLFNVFSNYDTGGTESEENFWIDNIRWCSSPCPTVTPTPITTITPYPSISPLPSSTHTPVLQECYGVYSESVPGCIFETTCDIGCYQGPGSSIELEEVGGAYPYMQAAINVPMPDGYAGWFVRCGTFEEPDTLDMSAYADGSLRFTARTDVELGIGIRSANIEPGDEESKTLLSDYMLIDGQWHSVCVPIPLFTELEEDIELNQMEALFNVFSNYDTGGTSRPEVFYIDEVEWRQIPCGFDSVSDRYCPHRNSNSLISERMANAPQDDSPLNMITRKTNQKSEKMLSRLEHFNQDQYSENSMQSEYESPITLEICLNQHLFWENEEFLFEIMAHNANDDLEVDLYLWIEIGDILLFWPEWNEEIHCENRFIEACGTLSEEIIRIAWPGDATGNLTICACMFYSGAFEQASNVACDTFRFE